MESSNVILKEYELIDEIKKTKEYQELLSSYNNLINDLDSKKLIEEFNVAKDNEKNNSNKETILKLSIAKRNLYNNELFIIYTEKLKSFNDLAIEIENKINSSLFSDEIYELFRRRKNQWSKE